MARATAVTATAILFCLGTSSCERLLGDVEVGSAPPDREQMSESEPAAAPVRPLLPYVPVSSPGVSEVMAGSPALVPPLDAGTPSTPAPGTEEPDAAPSAAEPKSVLVEGPALELERIGLEGGGPRFGVCAEGVAIGVQPTANPSLEVFGQRLTFLELVCGRVSLDPVALSIGVVRDDSMLTWDATPPLEGPPSREVPDPRVTWVLQPATLCPESAPVLVGLSGQYDPVAPDDTSSDAIRSLVIECAPLVLSPDGVDVDAAAAGHQRISQADSFAITGTASYESRCEAGSVVTQIHVDSGFWLDGFVLGCSRLRSP
jgi:hypothetical protein